MEMLTLFKACVCWTIGGTVVFIAIVIVGLIRLFRLVSMNGLNMEITLKEYERKMFCTYDPLMVNLRTIEAKILFFIIAWPIVLGNAFIRQWMVIDEITDEIPINKKLPNE